MTATVDRLNRLGTTLALAAAAAMTATAIAGSLAVAADPTACKVTNVDKGTGRDSLQRAVWAADPGDTLLVQGTCVGTTVVRKDLTIGWTRIIATGRLGGGKVSDSGPPMLRSGSWRPTLIIDPSVDDLHVLRGGTIKQGFVIGEVRDWRVPDKAAAPAFWTTWGKARAFLGGWRKSTLDICAVWDAADERRSFGLSAAVDAAGPGARLVLAGKCKGPTSVKQSLYVRGSRLPGDQGCREAPDDVIECIDYIDHGPPKIKGRLDISADVDEVAFRRLTLKGGVRIQ